MAGIMNPMRDRTMKTIWGMKLLSVIVVVDCLWLFLGVNANAKIKITGTSSPISEYSYGLLEFRQARHHIIENITAMMIIRVPTPIPRTLVDV